MLRDFIDCVEEKILQKKSQFQSCFIYFIYIKQIIYEVGNMSIKIFSNNVRYGIDLISLIVICDIFFSKIKVYSKFNFIYKNIFFLVLIVIE